MKKFLLLTLLLAGMGTLSAQVSPNALGVRLGGSNGFGSEISYQMAMGSSNRLQLDLGLHSNRAADAFKVTGTYQWVKPLQNDFSWYYGFGAGVGYVDFDNQFDADNNGTVLLSVEGILGIEYSLANSAGIPLQLALDFNPNINLLNDYYDDFDLDLALSIRWMF